MNYQILIVDDNEDNLFSTRTLLETQGYRIDVASSGKEAIELTRSGKKNYALILMDYDMPGLDGAQAGREILASRPKQQIAMYTCHDTPDAVKETLRSGLVEFFEKHMDPELFLERVQKLCVKYGQTSRPIVSDESPTEIERRLRSLGLVGRSQALAQVGTDIQTYAPANQTVVIRGESGTGKELVARALHNLSPRRNNPFIAVNCGAIPENLLESILFGHEKGSFTGSVKSQVGKFALAHRGTLFLDEIGDMPFSFQVKLLRVLQEQVIEPVGSNRVQEVDVRIIVASHKDLKEQVRLGNFREDLYYRVNVLEIEIPPLRERPEDIEALVAHFTEKCNQASGNQKSLESATLPFLMAHSWPGNVRELQHLVEVHLVKATGSVVRVEDLDRKLLRAIRLRLLSDLEARHLDEVIHFIRRTLAHSRSKSDAARIMGISPSRLHYYLETYGITA